jgi:hypothetical protein
MIRHYGWTDYVNLEPFPPSASTDVTAPNSEAAADQVGDPHLRSAREIAGYKVHARGREVERAR